MRGEIILIHRGLTHLTDSRHAPIQRAHLDWEDGMARADLGQTVAQEIAARGADREWICSLLDRAINVGHEEIRGRIRRSNGPFLADIATQVDDWSEHGDMACHTPVV
jgi:hypothetical protein